MTKRQTDRTLAKDLLALLAPKFAGLSVSVEHSERWNRMAVTFRWDGFAGLLPEERFHRLVQVIPEEVRANRMAELVWLELAPGETIDAFLELPRSEDIADREQTIYQSLTEAGFFEALEGAGGPSPEPSCGGGFAATERILTAKNFSPSDMRDAKLTFIRYGAYCDCQVLQTVRAEMSKQHVPAS